MRKFITMALLLIIGLTVWGEEMTLNGTLQGVPGKWFQIKQDDGQWISLAVESEGKLLGFDYAAKGIEIGDRVAVTGDFRLKPDGTPLKPATITNIEKK